MFKCNNKLQSSFFVTRGSNILNYLFYDLLLKTRIKSILMPFKTSKSLNTEQFKKL